MNVKAIQLVAGTTLITDTGEKVIVTEGTCSIPINDGVEVIKEPNGVYVIMQGNKVIDEVQTMCLQPK